MKNTQHYIYLKIWNPETDETEERPFYTSEVEDLIDAEIIDDDMLGAAMKNVEAFTEVMRELEGTAYTYEDIVNAYIEKTGERVVID